MVWNLRVVHRPAQRRQLVVLLTGVQHTADGSIVEDLFHEWTVRDARYALMGMHAVHILVTDNAGDLQMFINGQEATLQRTAVAGLGLSVVRYVVHWPA